MVVTLRGEERGGARDNHKYKYYKHNHQDRDRGVIHPATLLHRIIGVNQLVPLFHATFPCCYIIQVLEALALLHRNTCKKEHVDNKKIEMFTNLRTDRPKNRNKAAKLII